MTHESENCVYELIAHERSRDSPYTLFYFLAARGLARFIAVFFIRRVRRLSEIYHLYTLSNFDKFLDSVNETFPLTHKYERFVDLAETILMLFTKYGSEPFELE